MVNYEIFRNIEIFTKRLNDLKVAIDIEGLVKQIKKDEELIADPSFYEDLVNSQKVLKEIKKQSEKVEKSTTKKIRTEKVKKEKIKKDKPIKKAKEKPVKKVKEKKEKNIKKEKPSK